MRTTLGQLHIGDRFTFPGPKPYPPGRYELVRRNKKGLWYRDVNLTFYPDFWGLPTYEVETAA